MRKKSLLYNHNDGTEDAKYSKNWRFAHSSSMVYAAASTVEKCKVTM